MVWSPLAGGLLSGKYTLGDDNKTEGEGRRGKIDFPRVDKKLRIDLVEAMRPMAERRGGGGVAQIALAWLLHQEVVSTVIVGAKRADQLAENLAASEVELTAEELAELDELERARARVSRLDARLAERAPRRSASRRAVSPNDASEA